MKTRRQFIQSTAQGLMALGLSPSLAGPDMFRGSPARTGLIYHPRYLDHVLPLRRGETHPERPLRLRRILETLSARGLDQQLTPLPLLPDPMPYIRGLHTAEHVDSIREIAVTGRVAELAVAGALGAVAAVARGEVRNVFCAVRPPGHHANNTGREEGFCFYSNAAIAARYAQQVHGYQRILIIDWDYHHGNGTQNAFYDDPTVLFFSTHDWQAYPRTGDPSLTGAGEGAGLNINIHLDCGSGDADMLKHWDERLLPAVSRFQPDFIIISAGFDSRKDDLLGCFNVTDDGFRRMTRIALDLARDFAGGRLVSLLEGGYNVDGQALAVAAHVETLLEGA